MQSRMIQLVSFFSCASAYTFSATTCDTDCANAVGLTNQYRATQGLSPVCLNSKLMRAAKVQSDWQSLINKMTHDGPPGQAGVGERMTLQSYKWKSAAENVAVGLVTPNAVLTGWWNSPGHKKNILSDNIHMGLAYVEQGKFWTQIFGNPMYTNGEQCDVATLGGSNGFISPTPSPASLGPVPACGKECNAILDTLNQNRAYSDAAPACLNDLLQRATSAYTKRTPSYIKKVDSKLFESLLTEFGYLYKLYEVQATFSTGAMSKESLTAWVAGQSRLNKYTQFGISGTSDGQMWLIAAATPADPQFTCWTQGSQPPLPYVSPPTPSALTTYTYGVHPTPSAAIPWLPSTYGSVPTPSTAWLPSSYGIPPTPKLMFNGFPAYGVQPSYGTGTGTGLLTYGAPTPASVAAVPEPNVQCDGLCQRVVSAINNNRALSGLGSLCWNKRVVAAASQEVYNQKSKININALSAALKKHGYDSSNINARSFSLTFSGPVSSSTIESSLMAQIQQVNLGMDTYDHIGFAQYQGSGSVIWLMLLTTSWSPQDTCSVSDAQTNPFAVASPSVISTTRAATTCAEIQQQGGCQVLRGSGWTCKEGTNGGPAQCVSPPVFVAGPTLSSFSPLSSSSSQNSNAWFG